MRPSLTDIKPAEVTRPPARNDECWKVPGAIVAIKVRPSSYLLDSRLAFDPDVDVDCEVNR